MKISQISYKTLCWSIWLAVLILACIPGNAKAGGYFVQSETVKEAPDIISQRAIIAYNSGVEKLVIEPTLDGKGTEFGWIIPVPNKPMEIQQTDSGLIETFSQVLQPRVIDKLPWLIRLSFITLVVTLGCLRAISYKTTRRIWEMLLVLLIILLLCKTFFNGITIEGDDLNRGDVKVLNAQSLASYDLKVIKADSPGTLDQWLKSAGLAKLDEKAKAIVAGYIDRGWYFVAAKLKRDIKAGQAKAEPIAITFRTPGPVYPMNIAASKDSQVYMELFVIADLQGQCDDLTLEVCQGYNFRARGDSYDQEQTRGGFVSAAPGMNIGLPEARKFIWDGAMVSKLCGTLTPEMMGKDLGLRLGSNDMLRKHYFSQKGALIACGVIAMIAWCVFLPPSTIAMGNRSNGKSVKKILRNIYVPAFIFVVIATAGAYQVLPKVDSHISKNGDLTTTEYYRRQIAVRQRMAIAREYDHFAGMPFEEVAAIYEDFMKFTNSINPYTSLRRSRKQGPGDFTVTMAPDVVKITIYSKNGYPDELIIDGKPQISEVERVYAEMRRSRIFLLADQLQKTQDDSSKRAFIHETRRTPESSVEYHSFLAKVFKERPNELVGIIAENLRKFTGQPSDLEAVRFQVRILGCITRILPPVNIKTPEDLSEFIKNVELWDKSQSIDE